MCDFFNSSMITPISPLHRFPPSIHFTLIQAQLKKESQWPLTYSYWLTFLPFNVNTTQTPFPTPTLKRNTLKDLEQNVFSDDKHYLNLRGKKLVLDSPDNRGLWLLSQSKNIIIIPHSAVVAVGLHFYFAHCQQMEEVQ